MSGQYNCQYFALIGPHSFYLKETAVVIFVQWHVLFTSVPFFLCLLKDELEMRICKENRLFSIVGSL